MENSRIRSKKRDAILGALRESTDHPTADILYLKLKPSIPELSLGTVYRNLGVLVQDKMAVSVGRINGQERYEARRAPHAHFICHECSEIVDLDLPDMITGLFGEIENDFGFSPEGYSLSITGLCEKCKTSNNAAGAAENNNYKESIIMKNWICSVCGYTSKGETPPELCPVCKAPYSKFYDAAEHHVERNASLFEDEIDGKKLKAAMTGTEAKSERPIKKWVCTVCGNVHEGPNPPEYCPVCKEPYSKFKAAE